MYKAFERVNLQSNKSRYLMGAAVLLLLVVFGLCTSIAKAPFAFGSGDHFLFHAFGHWISHGEVFTKDFTHFRTPGPYYYYALMQLILGDSYHSTSFALLTESHVFQVCAGFTLALATSKHYWGRASLSLAFFTGLIFLIVPPIYQIRTAMPALCLAYYLFLQSSTPPHNLIFRQYCFLGALLGLCYWFGQELFIFLGLSITVAELSKLRHTTLKHLTIKGLALAIGILLAITPGLLYFWLNGVDLAEYFYNTTYYAFIIQPKGMDVPFPVMNIENIVFYIWIGVYIACALALSLTNKIYSSASICLISYCGLRLISMFGRADYLHMLFSISELIVLLPTALMVLIQKERPPLLQNLTHSLMLLIVLAGLLICAIKGSASLLLLVPVYLLGMSIFGQSNSANIVSPAKLDNKRSIYTLGISAASMILALCFTAPFSFSSLNFAMHAFRTSPNLTVLGISVSPERKSELDAVQVEISKSRAANIFSYPIRQDYYAFVNHHGSKFVEFAPQTTKLDIEHTIADLEKSRPELVFRDLDQVASLSPIIHELSDYIMMNYRPVKILQYDLHLEVLRRLPQPATTKRLFDNVYTLNSNHESVTAGLRGPSDAKGAVLVIAVNTGSALFDIASDTSSSLAISVYPEPGAASSGEVIMTRNGISTYNTVSVQDGRVVIQAPSGNGPVRIELKSTDDRRSVLWQDPILQ